MHGMKKLALRGNPSLLGVLVFDARMIKRLSPEHFLWTLMEL
jgi:hypothetical protein